MTLIAGDSEGFERSATIERFLGILRTCSEGLDWRRSAPRRPLSRAAAAQTYYGQFVQILRCYDRDQSFGIPPFTRSAHMDPVAELFKDHPDILDRLVRLVEEFGYGGTEEPAPEAAPEEPTPEGRIDYAAAIEFVNKIKARSTADAEEYTRFLAILRTHSKGDIKEVYARVAELFKDQPDLLSEFAHFLPARVSEPSPAPSPAPRTSSSDAEAEGQAPPAPMLVDEAAAASDLSGDDGDISLDESDQEFVDDSEQPAVDHATTTSAAAEIEARNAE